MPQAQIRPQKVISYGAASHFIDELTAAFSRGGVALFVNRNVSPTKKWQTGKGRQPERPAGIDRPRLAKGSRAGWQEGARPQEDGARMAMWTGKRGKAGNAPGVGLVGRAGLEPATKGFGHSRGFPHGRTISSPSPSGVRVPGALGGH